MLVVNHNLGTHTSLTLESEMVKPMIASLLQRVGIDACVDEVLHLEARSRKHRVSGV